MKQKAIVLALAALGTVTATSSVLAAADPAMIAARQKIFGFENVDAKTGAGRQGQSRVLVARAHQRRGVDSRSGDHAGHLCPASRSNAGPHAVRDQGSGRPEGRGGVHRPRPQRSCGQCRVHRREDRHDALHDARGLRHRADRAQPHEERPVHAGRSRFAIPQGTTINCVGVTTAGSVPGTEVVKLDQLEPFACIIGFRALHSVAVPADPDWGPIVVVDTPIPRSDAVSAGRAADAAQQSRTPARPAGPSAGARPRRRRPAELPVRRDGAHNFTLLFNNSVGALKEGKGSNWPNGTPADGQRLLDLSGACRPTDYFATLSSGNTDHNGWRDHVYLAQALKPKIMTTGHAPVGAALQYYAGFMNS